MQKRKLIHRSLIVFILLFSLMIFASPVMADSQTSGLDRRKDAGSAIGPVRFIKLDDTGKALPESATSWAMIEDNITGLVWEMKTNQDDNPDYGDPHDADNTYTWIEKEVFVKSLNDAHFGGYGDWRIPAIRELTGIVDYSSGNMGPMISPSYFPDTGAAWYWSATIFAGGDPYGAESAWGIDFGEGCNGVGKMDAPGCFRAVRGGRPGSFGKDVDSSLASRGDRPENSSAAGNYTDNHDGTVTDLSTKLMWQQKTDSTKRTWDDSQTYCDTLELGGHSDWRMPNIDELRGLVDFSRNNPAINITYFPDTFSSPYWSSTPNTKDDGYAWFVNFYYGDDYSNSKTSAYYVRAVRGEPINTTGILNITPMSREVLKGAGSTTFAVSNAGTGTMPWTAAVTSGGEWLTIKSGASGRNTGTITCEYTANTGTDSRTATIRVTAPGATGSPMDVTVTQAQPVLSVTPGYRDVAKEAGNTSFDVSNTGSGNLNWTAAVISGKDWLTIKSGSSGTNAGTISCSYTANVSTGERKATIRITANGATDSPSEVTVTQAPLVVQPVLSVSPASRDVAKEAGSSTFGVSNTGNGTMSWTAAVTSGGEWLTIKSGASGTNSGTITCGYTVNTGTASRSGIIRITANGAESSPVDVRVTQAGTPAQPAVLSLTPTNRSVAKESGSTTFGVSNTGSGTMNWTAAVIDGGEWLTIKSGSSGSNTGTISCSFTANTGTEIRTGTVRITANGATGSPADVTVSQAGGSAQPAVLSVTPTYRLAPKEVGSTTFGVSNTGSGTMNWTAAVITGGEWLTITSGGSGSNGGTITCEYTANTGTEARSATVRVTANGATGSPADVTVSQAGLPDQPAILSVSPASRVVSKDAGSTTFNVSNTGKGTMPWAALVTSGEWLTITSGSSGSNTGTITCNYSTNTDIKTRTATIQITSNGATGSPATVTVSQGANTSACTATMDGNLSIHIPLISLLNPYSGAPSCLADFAYEYNPAYPTLIIFKLTNAAIVQGGGITCDVSTLADNLDIHIPDMLFPDGITRFWVDISYSKALSTNGSFCWYVTGYGAVGQ